MDAVPDKSNDLAALTKRLLKSVEAASGLAALEAIRVSALGKKGEISELMKQLGTMAPEARKSFGAAVNEVVDTLRPHRLCGYLYDLATAFTAFFEACPVLKAPDDATRESRFALCAVTARVLACGLDLLGMQAPERM